MRVHPVTNLSSEEYEDMIQSLTQECDQARDEWHCAQDALEEREHALARARQMVAESGGGSVEIHAIEDSEIPQMRREVQELRDTYLEISYRLDVAEQQMREIPEQDELECQEETDVLEDPDSLQ